MIQCLSTISLLLAALAAEPVSVHAVLDAPETPFFRTAAFSVVVDAPDSEDVKIGRLQDDIDGLEISEGGYASQSAGEGRKRISQTFVLDPIKSAIYMIPPIKVTWGDDGEAFTPAMAFRVRELTDAEKERVGQFEDIVMPGLAAEPVTGWKLGLRVAAAILLIAAAVMWYLRRNKAAPAAPQPKPWEVALHRLEELSRRHLPEQGEFGKYYVDLSAILRYYIEDRFHLHAPDRTTQELLSDVVAGKVLTDEQQTFLAKFLRHCDYVKFAQYQPSPKEMDGGMAMVRRFVQDTVPPPEADSVEKAA